MRTNSVVVLGSGINALGVVRSFADLGIDVYVIDKERDVAGYSKYCGSFLYVKEERILIAFLLSFLSKFKRKPVIFPTSDFYLLELLKNYTAICQYAYIPISNWNIVSPLLEKEYLYTLAEKYNIPHPKTVVINTVKQLTNAVNQIGFPVVVKPSVTTGFASEIGEKAPIIYSKKDLCHLKSLLEDSSFCNKTLVVQEFIPGKIEDLYTITSFSDKNSNLRGYSIGHKIRQSPPVTGTIISGKVEHIEEILEAAKVFIKVSTFHGISNIEFKYDKRDNTYKLIEINPRTGMWNLSALRSGVNLPLMAYKECLGFSYEDEFNKTGTLVWLDTLVDLYNTIIGFKYKGYPEYCLSLSQWWSSVKGKKIDAIFNVKDIKPFLHSLKRFISLT